MPRLLPWLFAVAVLIISVLCGFLWREHNQLIVLQAKLAAADAGRAQIMTARRELAAARTTAIAGSTTTTEARAAESSPSAASKTLSATERQIRGRMLEYQRWTRLSKKAGMLAAM